ncbi:head-tail connector protein [Pseudomonas quasicaspiana]|uniref:head-tail connector protein n=1 Tax=Pseudomonas quasicaspiana TaxID=2829821 RepID=UPI001E493FC3|nr:head-tail connector protein [Pseudomonas quasicaspiana]MCD5980508.1 head-tail connector protein [Pseudomonas quasicaspiana]
MLMLTLQEIKEHCRVELDQTEEDRLLRGYGRAAWRLVANVTGRKLYEVTPPEDATEAQLDDPDYLNSFLPPDAPENAVAVDEDLRLAMLLMVAHWRRNREAVTDALNAGVKEVPLAFAALTGPYLWVTL